MWSVAAAIAAACSVSGRIVTGESVSSALRNRENDQFDLQRQASVGKVQINRQETAYRASNQSPSHRSSDNSYVNMALGIAIGESIASAIYSGTADLSSSLSSTSDFSGGGGDFGGSGSSGSW